ncbi:hypothetical protein M9R32_08150 [Paenisporosarcina quisquiliarum]|uniref:Uncharacterized protein n=1 Tax=Paenisporosarcina quisquiliarum TaxID=365346 RepID=A0A9X3LG86_9BACL|nr:hypothetical protein [Paenisporosarcina quisquiliarum]MCZ8537147.1 hypothetical protein [Paenisporosarcina quisquiliarum]
MKNIMLFTILIGLGFTGGSLFPDIMADAENSKAEEKGNCNCGCGPTEVKVMMVPTGSDMTLTTGLIEAISNDSDNTLTQEELVTIINQVQKEYTQTTEQSAVKGISTGSPSDEGGTTVSSYEKIINSFLSGNLTTTTDTQKETETIVNQSESVSGTSSIILNEETTETTNTKKTKNNNGLGNGSEEADGTSSDVKGIDPSNPGNGQKNSNTSTKTEVKSTTTTNGKTNVSKSKEKKEKEKNNNGLGNGSEPADGTSTDIKGEDPSNPGNGGSKNNAGNK